MIEDIVFYFIIYTVHSESIQTPSLFPHFVTEQPYSKMVEIFLSIYTQYPIVIKKKQVLKKFIK